MGFCGQPLRVRVQLAEECLTDCSTDLDTSNIYNCFKYLYYAEIRPSKQRNLSAVEFISGKELIQRTRTKKMNEKGEIFLGGFPLEMITKVDGIEEFTLQFNSEQCSYDYGWKSNRWSGPSETHVIDIICVKQLPNDVFKICSFCSSDPFVVLSNHKRRIQNKSQSKRGQTDTSLLEESKKSKRKKQKIEADAVTETTQNEDTLSVSCSTSVVSLSSGSSLNDDEGSMVTTASILTMLSNTMDRSKYLFDKVYLQQQAAASTLSGSYTPREHQPFYQHHQQQRGNQIEKSFDGTTILEIPNCILSSSLKIPGTSASNLFSTSAHHSNDNAFMELEYMNTFW